MADRSSRADVRNPILALPAAREIIDEAPPEVRAWLKRLLLELNAQCREKEVEAYRKRKGPMTSYWMAAATYVKHIAHALRPDQRRGNIDRSER